MSVAEAPENTGAGTERVSFMWLEITGKCQLACVHCYAESGPQGNHGSMSRQDWFDVIRQAHEIGVETVAFIGGEPTLHPDLKSFIEYALELGLRVGLVSNLVHVPEDLWSILQHPDVTVGASYYSDDPDAHDAVTLRRGSHRRTAANLRKAARLGVSVKGLVTTVGTHTSTERTQGALADIGVTQAKVAPVQAVGRASEGEAPAMSDLCGQCSGNLLAVDPNGTAFPCTMGRWLDVGNVRERPLREVVADRRLREVRRQIRKAFDPEVTGKPGIVIRDACSGAQDGGSCNP